MGKSQKTIFLDKLHKGAVTGIFIFSGFCGMLFFYRFYNFVYNVRPQLRDARHQAEEELLSEGKPSEEEFSAA